MRVLTINMSSALLSFIFKNIVIHKVYLNYIYILQGFPQPSMDEAENYQLPLLSLCRINGCEKRDGDDDVRVRSLYDML
jgi:hypothetical protein